MNLLSSAQASIVVSRFMAALSALSLTALSLAGCGDSSSGAGGASSTTGATSIASSASTTASSSSGSVVCVEPSPNFDANGCLTAQSASILCGTTSDQRICTFSVSCGFSTPDVSQCNINCEQSSASSCNDDKKTQCIIDATCKSDCNKLKACGFIL